MNKATTRYFALLLFLLFLSCISGYLMSMPSLVGRIGISLFYKQYSFLKTWWQGALAVFAFLAVMLSIQAALDYRIRFRTSRLVHIVCLLLAIVGFYFMWQDFHHTTTHRWLRHRFHIGGYLVWLGWVVVSITYLLRKKIPPATHA